MVTNRILWKAMNQNKMHQLMAHTLDAIIAEIKMIQNDARQDDLLDFRCGPMIILRTPKGWTGPKIVDGKPVEGTWRAHQVPLRILSLTLTT